MRTFWLTAHLVGMALWIGGGVATMVAGIVSKRLAPGPDSAPIASRAPCGAFSWARAPWSS